MRVRRVFGPGGPVLADKHAGAIADSLFLDDVHGVALLDLDGIVLQANARFAELAGCALGELAWMHLSNEGAALRTPLHAGQAAQADVTRLQADTRQKLRLSLLPVPGRGGLLRVCDHTYEQDLEDQLEQSRRLQAVGELAGGIAHDFNNLLTAILGATEDLQARAASRPEDHADMELIRTSTGRGAALVRHLLAFSRQQTLQPRVVALNEAVRNAADLLRRLVGPKVRLELSLEEPGRNIRIDPTQLDQVLMNLAVNASNAMPQGGHLRIVTGHDLRLRAEALGGETVPPGRYASLSIADTGAGIAPEVLPRIFEPFFTTRKESGGTGLGLSTVHGIVRQSGGFMDVHSVRGEGTRFDILLPRHEDQVPWQAATPPVAPPLRRKAPSRTLLLVDDEAAVRLLAERVLLRAGWQVVTASCAEDALELVDAGNLGDVLACVISDVVMPGLDGPALVRTLRRGQPGLPAILMSGYADAQLRQALQAADISFLGKPFGMGELTTTLRSLLAA